MLRALLVLALALSAFSADAAQRLRFAFVPDPTPYIAPGATTVGSWALLSQPGAQGSPEGTLTASITAADASFTASLGNNNGFMTVTAISSGKILPGATATVGGSSVPVIAQTSGTPGGIGNYSVPVHTAVASSASTTSGVSEMTVTAVSAGTIGKGSVINGAGVTTNSLVLYGETGTGGTGTYVVSNSQTVGSESISLYGLGYGTPVVANWDFVPWQTITGTGQLCVVAAHPPTAAEYAGGKKVNIDHVDFAANNGSTTTVSTTKTGPSNQAEYCAFIRAADITAALGADGQAEVRATVYPTTGIPTVLQGAVKGDNACTASIAADILTVTTCTSLVLGVNVSVSMLGIAPGTWIDGTSTANATSCVASTGSNCTGAGGSGKYHVTQSQTLASASMDPGDYWSMFITSNSGGTLPGTLTYVDSNVGVDTGNCQTQGSPCATISYAVGQIRLVQAGNDVGGGHVKLAAGSYVLGSASENTTRAAANRWLVVEPQDGVDPSTVIISSVGASGIRTTRVEINNLALQAQVVTGNVFVFDGGALWLNNVAYSRSNAFQNSGPTSNAYSGLFLTGGSTINTGGADVGENLIQNYTINNIGGIGDALQRAETVLNVTVLNIDNHLNATANTTSGSAVLTNVSNFANVYDGSGILGPTSEIPTGTTISSHDSIAGTITMSKNATLTRTAIALNSASHPDVWQGLSYKENILIAQMTATNNVRSQGFFTDGSSPLGNAAVINSSFSNLPNSYGFVLMQLGNQTRNLFWSNVTWGGTMQWRTDQHFTATNVLVQDNTCTNAITPTVVTGVSYRGSTSCGN